MITAENIIDVINKYNNLFDSNAMFLAYLRDLFPDDELYVTLLYDALCLGIAEEIKESPEVSNIMQNRYVKLLCNRYGVSKENAVWAITTWARVYEKDSILDDSSNCEIADEESSDNYTTYPYDIIFDDDIDEIINNFQFDTVLEPNNIKLKFHFVSYLSILVTRPQDSKDKEMYVLKLIEEAINKINIKIETFEDELRDCLLRFTKGYTLLLQGDIDDAFNNLCSVYANIKRDVLSAKRDISERIALDELYKACVLNIYTILKICDIHANVFFNDNQDIVSECLQEACACNRDGRNESAYYFYTMSSPANDFYNVRMDAGDKTFYSLPDLNIGYLRLLRTSNTIDINWDVYGNKLYYSIELTSKMIENIKKQAQDYIII